MQLIFTHIAAMINAQQANNTNYNTQPTIAIFAGNMDHIYLFHDSKQHDRVALYLRWLIDGFQDGLTRVETISKANHNYKHIYGADKVIDKTVLSQTD